MNRKRLLSSVLFVAITATVVFLSLEVWPWIMTTRVPVEVSSRQPLDPVSSAGWPSPSLGPGLGRRLYLPETLYGWRHIHRTKETEVGRFLWDKSGWLRVRSLRIDPNTLVFQFWRYGGVPESAVQVHSPLEPAKPKVANPTPTPGLLVGGSRLSFVAIPSPLPKDSPHFPKPREQKDAPWLLDGISGEEWWIRMESR